MSVGDAKNQGRNADIIIVSSALVGNLSHLSDQTTVIGLKNLLSKEEILEKLKASDVVNS